MKKIMKALRFPSAIKLKGLLAHIKNINRCPLRPREFAFPDAA